MIRKQLEESLLDPLGFWKDKTSKEVEQLMGSDVAAMVAFDQRNPHHCYDLFTHSLHTVAGIKDTASTCLRVAAFFHDIGKPTVAMEKQGRLVFYGHAQKSADKVSVLLRDIGYSEDEIKEICFYIKHHDDFIPWVLPEEKNDEKNKYFVPINKENLQRHIDKVRRKTTENDFHPNMQNWKNLLDLCYADASAQANEVIQNGVHIDSKEHKLSKIKELKKCIRLLCAD